MHPNAPAPYAAPPVNTLAIAGFVCAIVGLFTGGLISPIGLLLCLIGLGKEPRGYAVWGIVISLFGMCGWLLVVAIFGAAVLALLGLTVVAISMSEPQQSEVTVDMLNIAAHVQEYQDERRFLPADLGSLTLDPAWLVDPWGRAYQYHLTDEGDGFDLLSAGADGAFGSDDDVRLSELGERWFAGSGVTVDRSENEDGGRVRIRIGGRSVLEAVGDEDGGTVTINLGDRVIEIDGDDGGGAVEVRPPTPEAPDAP